MVGILPTYESIGVAATAALIALRLLQGLALGGEYGGAATYVAEHSPPGKRGLYTAWIQTTATLGFFLSLTVILATRVLLGETTGAPFYFAQVTFNEVKPNNYFLGGKPLENDQIFVHGTIRDGRTTIMKDKLITRMAADVASASGVEAYCVWVYISELPPGQMVEFGRVLPLHGKEAEWAAALPAAEKARLEAIGIRAEPRT